MTRDRGNVIFLAMVLVTVMMAGSAVAQAPGPPCPGGGKIGPCPGWVDLNANGMYDAGEPLVLVGCAEPGSYPVLTIDNPWSTNCNDTSGNVIYFTNANGNCLTQGHRLKGREQQEMGVTGFNGSNQPVSFSFEDDGASGGGSLTGPGGGFNGLSITGGLTMMIGPFLGTDISGKGGTFNYMSIPWGLAETFGMNGPCMLGASDPQVFLPVVDIGNGQYQLQFDLCSDSRFCSSPPLSLVAWTGLANNIPTLSEWGTIVLLLGLASVGWWFLRRQQVLA